MTRERYTMGLVVMAFFLSLSACAPGRRVEPTTDGGSQAVAATDWSQIREIVHDLRRAHPTYETPMSTQGEKEAALAIAERAASALARTSDAGLTPSQRLYKYDNLAAAHFFAAFFTAGVNTKIVHLEHADDALLQAARAESEVKVDETWNAGELDQLREAQGYTAMLAACVRALQFQAGRTKWPQVDAAIEAIPEAYRALHPPNFDRTLRDFLSMRAVDGGPPTRLPTEHNGGDQ